MVTVTITSGDEPIERRETIRQEPPIEVPVKYLGSQTGTPYRHSLFLASLVSRGYNGRLVRYLEQARDSGAETRIDLGVGDGYRLAKTQVPGIRTLTGVDLSPDKLDKARQVLIERGLGDVELLRGDVADPRLCRIVPDGSADIVTATDVLEHLDDSGRLVREAHRITRRYAVFASPWEPVFRGLTLAKALVSLNYPDRMEYVRRWGLDPEHVQSFTRGGFTHLIEDNGFRVLDSSIAGGRWTVVLAEKK